MKFKNILIYTLLALIAIAHGYLMFYDMSENMLLAHNIGMIVSAIVVVIALMVK